MTAIRHLILPGWHGSPSDHWQSHWQARLVNAGRVEQQDWLRPERDLWVAALQRELLRDPTPTVLIAHSLGCITVAHWARQAPKALKRRILGALLVAPADVDRPTCPEALRNFAPLPDRLLPFPSLIIGADNDPAAGEAGLRRMAEIWGSDLRMLPGAGHINVQSGHRQWEQGLAYLDQLLHRATHSKRQSA